MQARQQTLTRPTKYRILKWDLRHQQYSQNHYCSNKKPEFHTLHGGVLNSKWVLNPLISNKSGVSKHESDAYRMKTKEK